MSIPISVGDVLVARFVCQLDDQVAINRRLLRVTADDAVDPPTDTSLAAGLDSLFALAYKDSLVSDATYRGVSLQRIIPLPKTIPAVGSLNAGPGTQVGNPMPPQTAGVYSLRADFAGRTFQGRSYQPFPSDVSNDAEGKPTAAYRAVLSDLGLAFSNPIVINGTVSGSTTLQPTLDPTGAAPNRDLTSFVTRLVWGTQRRRGGFGASNVPPF